MLGMECSGSWWRAQRTTWRLSYLDEVLVKTTNIGGRFSKTWSQRIRINGRENQPGTRQLSRRHTGRSPKTGPEKPAVR